MAAQFEMPRDAGGFPIPGFVWTGEVQSISFTDTSTTADKITVDGRWLMFYATAECHIVIGNDTIHSAHATAGNRCFPIPNGDTAGWVGPFYIPPSFDTTEDGEGDLYIRVIRNAADGVLYIASAYSSDTTLGRGATSSSTTTTTTTT